MIELNQYSIMLKAKRLEQGLSQKEVAEQVGVSSSTVSNWERGRRLPNDEQKKRLEEVLKITGRKLTAKDILKPR